METLIIDSINNIKSFRYSSENNFLLFQKNFTLKVLSSMYIVFETFSRFYRKIKHFEKNLLFNIFHLKRLVL